jgi:hypothetical protein
MDQPRPITAALGWTGLLLAGALAGCAAAPTKEEPPVAGGRPAAGAGDALLSAGLVAALLVLAGALAVGAFWAGRRTTHRPAPAPAYDPRLVRGLIGGHDLARDEAVRGHIEQVLREVGVVALRPAAGTPVTAGRMEVVGTAPAGPSGPAGSVAEVIRAGWADGSLLLRPAQVVVFAGSEPPTHPHDERELHR